MTSFIKRKIASIKQFFRRAKNELNSVEDEEFIDDTQSSLLTKVTPVANGIIYVVILFFIIGLIWAAFSQIDVVISAAGTVIPSSRDKLIQSLDGGIVKSILVKEGDMVKQNQPLIILDDTRYKADFEQNYLKRIALEAAIARLNAEVEGSDHIDFPKEVSQYPQIAQNETDLFNTREQAYKDQIKNLEENYVVARNEMMTYEKAFKEGIVPKVDYFREQRFVSDAKEKILELKNKHWEDARSALVQATADLGSLDEQLKGLQDKINRTVLRSPVNGVVKKINVTSELEAVSPFMTIMEVVPVEDKLLIQAHVKPSDIAFVHIGQPALMQMTAYDYTIYGTLSGKVEYVSPDAIQETKPGEERSGSESFYLVNIRTEHNYLGTKERKLPILPGMDANVKIITGKKTILHYILKPLVKAKEEALRER